VTTIVTPGVVRSNRSRLWFAIGLVAAVVAIYATTLAAAWQAMGFGTLPPRLAADLYQHLTLSNLPVSAPGIVLNPWYHVPVPEAEVVFLRFGLALRTFHMLHRVVGDHLGLALFLWNVVWTLLIATSALWLVSSLHRRWDAALLAVTLGVLLLVDVTGPRLLLARVVHGVTPPWPLLTLPYIRSFYPQVAIPLLLAYVTLNMRVLRKPEWGTWLAMGALQFAGLLTFPYITPLMAGVTGLSVLGYGSRHWEAAAWPRLVTFAVACGVADVGFVVGSVPALHGFSGGAPIVRFDPVRFRAIVGYTFVVLGVLSYLVVRRLRARPEVRATLAALGLATALLFVSDVLITSSLQISNHVNYLIHTTVAVLVVALGGDAYERVARRVPRWVITGVAALTFGYGCVAGYVNYAWFREENVARAQLARELASAGPGDLVIAANDFWEDEASWLPLAAPAQVLFSLSAGLALPAEAAPIEARRLALLLYLQGETVAGVERLLSEPGPTPAQRFLAGFRRIQPLTGAEREHVLAAVRVELLPPLAAAERLGPEVRDFLRGFRRIFVLDRRDRPFFENTRLDRVVRWEGERSTDQHWTVRWGAAL
jgi:hypothetical protein